tara:strand:- start:3031 stop:3591 length:561 start_codon:yes stop_codon:yes gene_type:complete
MINGRKWFAFFSHTGTEILNLSKDLGIVPDYIVTNNAPGNKNINKELLKLSTQFSYTSEKPKVADYDRLLIGCNECICTLHGWMRIIPKSICKEYEMYNLHPGLIDSFPELKGKDPQARVCSEIHDKIGLVIHRVTPGVDEGEVLLSASCKNHYYSVESVTRALHKMARQSWVDFFNHYVLSNEDD